MVLGPNIAKNAALRENVFMITVCIELRIPLFLVGKPGSSKSLAKTIVANSLQGQSSTNGLLKCLKQVSYFNCECSILNETSHNQAMVISPAGSHVFVSVQQVFNT